MSKISIIADKVVDFFRNLFRTKHVNLDNICLVTIANDDYFDYVYTMINSFVQNNDWFKGDIVILNNANCMISERNLDILRKVYGKIKIRFVSYDTKAIRLVEKTKVTSLATRWVYSTILKYEIFKMDRYDKVLFLDADCVVLKSLKPLFKMDTPIGAVIDDYNSMGIEDDILKTNTIGGDYDFNTGMIYLGNKTYLNRETYDDIMTFAIEKTGTINERETSRHFGEIVGSYPEQDIMSMYFVMRGVLYLPIYYNTINCGAYYGPGRIDKKEVIDAVKKVLRDIDETCVLHYIVKPDHLMKGSYGTVYGATQANEADASALANYYYKYSLKK